MEGNGMETKLRELQVQLEEAQRAREAEKCALEEAQRARDEVISGSTSAPPLITHRGVYPGDGTPSYSICTDAFASTR